MQACHTQAHAFVYTTCTCAHSCTALSWIRAHADELQIDASSVHTPSPHPKANASSTFENTTDPVCSDPGLNLQPNGSQADSAAGQKHSGKVELINPASCWDLHLHLPAGAIPKVRTLASFVCYSDMWLCHKNRKAIFHFALVISLCTSEV